ncbi:protein kinase [bacterium]|nr:protein kinase [candidate division CSSED10-310 bacterium]
MIEQRKIIIGGDDMDNLRAISMTLRNAGYSVVLTPTSNRIFRMVKKEPPDLVILSNNLKDLDGIETSRILVDRLGFPNPILMVASDSAEQTIMKAYEAGVSDYLVQPCPPGLLRAKVKLLIEHVAIVAPAAQDDPFDAIDDPELQSEFDLPAYRIIEKIGSGAMGDVFRAIHKITFETVAIKVVHSSKVKSIRDIQRFFRGSLIGLELPRHPNLVQIIEIKKFKDSIYQVMEFVDGKTLQTVIRKKHLLTEAEAVCVLKDVSLALDMLQQHQVIHRDVKPGNIFLTRDWLCKLGDLGISRRLIDRTATTTGHVVGTPGYISPEQVLDIRPLDIRTDIYSLGLTLFHGIAGSNPFNRETPYESMLARLQGPEAVLDEQNAGQISQNLRDVINRMIRRRAAERYATPLSLLSDLEKLGLFASQEPTDTNPQRYLPEESPGDN